MKVHKWMQTSATLSCDCNINQPLAPSSLHCASSRNAQATAVISTWLSSGGNACKVTAMIRPEKYSPVFVMDDLAAPHPRHMARYSEGRQAERANLGYSAARNGGEVMK